MRGGARICIITPGAVGANPRVVKEANALSESGLDVRVISTRTLDLVDKFEEALLRDAPWACERLEFRKPVLRRAMRLVQEAAVLAYRSTPTFQFASYAISVFTPRLVTAALAVEADLYVAHYPAALPAADAAARKFGARLAFDAEDFHPGEWEAGRGDSVEKRVVEHVERQILPRCSYLTAASPGIGRAYSKMYGIANPVTILNVFPCDEAPKAPCLDGDIALNPSVYWFSQVVGPNRGLEAAIAAIGLAECKPHLYLRGIISSDYREELIAHARRAGVEDRVHLLPPEPPAQMVRLASAYGAGLVLETGHTENRSIALTNKQFTYILAGVPCIMSDVPAHREFAGVAGNSVMLFEVDNERALAACIDRMFADPDDLVRRRIEAFRLGQKKLNWDCEKGKLVDVVERVLMGTQNGI